MRHRTPTLHTRHDTLGWRLGERTAAARGPCGRLLLGLLLLLGLHSHAASAAYCLLLLVECANIISCFIGGLLTSSVTASLG